MKNKRNKRQIAAAIVAIFLALLMILGAIAPFLYGATAASIEAEVEIGYSGSYKLGYPSPARAYLTNKGADFKGEFQIKVRSGNNYDQKNVIYAYEIELPENSSKSIEMDMDINNLGYGVVAARVVDSAGRTVTTKNLRTTPINPESVLAGVLTDTPSNLAYLRTLPMIDDINGEKPLNNVIFLEKDTFPSTLDNMSSFNYIFISNYDTSRLSPSQTEALGLWVMEGGRLVIGGGVNADKSLKGLGGIINGNTTGVSRISSIGSLLGDFERQEREFSGNNKMIDKYYSLMEEYLTSIESKADEELERAVDTATFNILEEYNSFGSLAYSIKRGNGRISLISFDYGLPPASEVKIFREILTYAISMDMAGVNRLGSYRDYYRNYNYIIGSYLLSNIPVEDNSLMWFGYWSLFGYAIFIGPVMYLILRKKDRKERGLIYIPSAAVALTVALSLLSLGTVYKKPVFNIASVTDIYNGESNGSLKANIAAMTPEKGDVVIRLLGTGYNTKLLGSEYYDSYQNPNQNQNTDYIYAKILKGQNPKISFHDVPSWGANMFYITETLDLGGGLLCDLTILNGELKGEITNNTSIDFEDVLLLGNNSKRIKIGSLKSGVTVSIGTEGEISGVFQNTGYNYNYINPMEDNPNATRTELWRANMRTRIMESSMNNMGQYNSYAKFPSPTSAIGDGLTLYAFSSEKAGSFAATVNNRPPKEYYNNMYRMSLTVQQQVEGPFVFPFGSISISRINGDSYFDYDIERLYLSDCKEIELAYIFTEKDSIDYFIFNNFLAESDNPSAFEALIYNVAKDEWETLRFSRYENNAANYFNGNGEIKIRILNNGGYNTLLPKIEIGGNK